MPALTGIRILDLSRFLPGPFGTMILADHGAEVIKVEEPGTGDPLRHLHGSLEGVDDVFARVNRSKRSVAIDLRREIGRAFFHKLLERADVLVEGFRPGVMQRLGLDYPSLSGRYPKLVYCSISGFGQTGPRKQLPAHDLINQGYAGVLPTSDGSATMPPSLLADFQAGMTAALGIMLALFERTATGAGKSVDVDMTRSLAPLLLPALGIRAPANSAEHLAKPWFRGGLACYDVYRTADGRQIAMAALEEKFWREFCDVAGRADLVQNHLHPDRQPLLREELATIFAQHPAEYWLEMSKRHDICIGLVRTPAEALADNCLRDAGWPSPFSEPVPPAPAPQVGADTRQILVDELGCDPAEVQRAFDAGVL